MAKKKVGCGCNKKVGESGGGMLNLQVTGNAIFDLILGGVAGGIVTDLVQKNILDKIKFIRDTPYAPAVAKILVAYYGGTMSESDFFDGLFAAMGGIGGAELLADAGITTGRLAVGNTRRQPRNKKPGVKILNGKSMAQKNTKRAFAA